MTCRQAAEVISRSLDTRLSTGDRVGLGVHTLFCGPCRRFRGQLFRIHTASAEAVDRDAPAGDGQLPAAARARIAAALAAARPAD